MKSTFRMMLSLVTGISVVALGFAFYQVSREKRALRNDLEKHASILA